MPTMADKKGASVARASTLMAFTTTLSRLTGFLKWLAITYALGRTVIADAYNLANNLPNMIYELIMGGVLTAAFIPVVMDYLSRGEEEEGWKVASLIMNFVFLVLLSVALIGIFFPYPFVRIQMLLVSPEKTKLVQFFFRFFIVQIVFYGFCASFTGILNSKKHFFAPSAAPIFNNLIVITTLLLYVKISQSSSFLSLIVLAIGTTLGVASMALTQIPYLRKVGYRYYFHFNFRHPDLKKFLLLGIPTVIFVLILQAGNTVINNLASQFRGGISAYVYSWAFFQLPHGILTASIIIALFPRLCEAFSLKEMEKFRDSISRGLKAIAFVTAPASALLVALSPLVIQVAFERGKFTHADTLYTASVLSLFALGVLSFGYTAFLARAFYALKDAKTPTFVNGIGILLMSVLNIALVNIMGVKGIGLSNTIAYTFTFFILFYLLGKRVGAFWGKELYGSLIKIIFNSIIMGLFLYAAFRVREHYFFFPTKWGAFLFLLLITVLGFSLYLFLSYLMRLEELSYLKRLIRTGLEKLGWEIS
jgi:putative peptidoglycan lipid II flippase